MTFIINTEFAALEDSALAEYLTAARAAGAAMTRGEVEASLEDIEALADHVDEVAAAITAREVETADRAARQAALADRFSAEEGGEEDDAEDDADDEGEDDEDDGSQGAPGEEAAAEESAPPAKKTAAAVAAKTKRPAKPGNSAGPVTITAAADVPGFATSSKIESMERVGEALVNRMKGFGIPQGDGMSESLQHFGVAQFRLDFPQELVIDRGTDDMEVLTYASKEQRLPGNSLVAANGWCAPSETVYDLCAGETTDGILSIAEVEVRRGGIKHTSGPDFASIYSAVGFLQTEAQAISGTTKACVEVPCPSFTDTRLDAIGLCIKAPILLNAAYPEVTNRYLSGSMIAHQHKVNASVISRMVAYAGSARVFTGLGSTVADTLESIELVILQSRQKYALSMSQTLEVVLPHWYKGAARADLGRRNGRAKDAVTDAEIQAHFAAIKANVQFVYDWQNLTLSDEVYPSTVQALVYPAGTFVKGTSSVITLNAVYDAASLATNMYTALFFEQGLLVAQMCYNADLVTLPICNAGRTGAPNFTCA